MNNDKHRRAGQSINYDIIRGVGQSMHDDKRRCAQWASDSKYKVPVM